MTKTDLTQLNNIEPLNLTLGSFNTSTQATNTLITTAQSQVGNFWFIGSILVLFLFLNWFFYKQESNIQLDLTRSVLTSSTWCFFISAGFLLGGLISTIYPLIWFSTLTLISWFGVQSIKDRGQ